MSGSEYGIALAFVVLFTYLYDMVDLKPDAGSYLFVRSLSYFIYLSFRAALGVVAVFIMDKGDVALPLFVMGLFGSLTSLAFLESFGLSVRGEKLATLDPLLQRFRRDILDDNTARIAANRTKGWYSAIQRLTRQDETTLKAEVELWAGQLSFSGDEIKAELDNQLKAIPQAEAERRRGVYASAIVKSVNALQQPGLLDLVMEKYSAQGRWWPPWRSRR